MEQSTVNQRLNLIVDTFEKGVKAAFARKAGISPQGAQEILAGRKGDPSFKVLVKILESYPAIDANWLVLGRGEMLRAGMTTPLESLDQKSSSDLMDESNTPLYAAFLAQQEKARKEIEELFDRANMLNVVQDVITRKAEELLEAALRENRFIKQFNEQIIRERIEDIGWLEKDAAHLQLEAEHRNSKTDMERLAEINHAIALLKNMQVKEGQMLESFNYSIGEGLDATKPFSGSLAKRLDITEDAARELVTSGAIGSLHIEGQGYTITEQAVRKYLEKQLPS
jgi:hypothetical protein